MAEAGLLAELELVVRLVLVLVHILQEVRSQGRREWMRKIGVDHNTHTHKPAIAATKMRNFPTTCCIIQVRTEITVCTLKTGPPGPNKGTHTQGQK